MQKVGLQEREMEMLENMMWDMQFCDGHIQCHNGSDKCVKDFFDGLSDDFSVSIIKKSVIKFVSYHRNILFSLSCLQENEQEREYKIFSQASLIHKCYLSITHLCPLNPRLYHLSLTLELFPRMLMCIQDPPMKWPIG